MKCEECLLIIEEYIDGELDEQAARLISGHVAGCSACASVCEELRREQEIYNFYQRDIEVSPALWAGVRARIGEEKAARAANPLIRLRDWFAQVFSAPRFSPALAAVLVVVTVGITVGLMKYLNSREAGPEGKTTGGPGGEIATVNRSSQPPEPNKAATPTTEKAGGESEPGGNTAGLTASAGENESPIRRGPVRAVARQGSRVGKKPAASAHEPTPDELVREAEQKYLAAISILSRDVKNHQSQLDPDVLARFEKTLSVIDQTIAETRRAVREHPRDPVAVQYMLAAYSKKVEVLKEMTSY